MSSAVRRLVLDFEPRWSLMALLFGGLLVLTNCIWLADPEDPVLVAAWFAGFAFAPNASKAPTWRFLPVSRLQRGRARWWHSVGLPLPALAAGMTLAMVVGSSLGWTLPPASDIVTILLGQYALCVALPTGILLGAVLSHRIHPAVGTGAIALVLLGSLAALMTVSLNPASRPWMAVAGALGLIGAAILYALARHLPEGTSAEHILGERNARSDGPQTASRNRSGQTRVQAPGPKGWAAYWIAHGAGAAYFGIPFVVAAVLANRVLNLPFAFSIVLVYFLVAFTAAQAVSMRTFTRVFRILPMSSFGLTVAFQSIVVVIYAVTVVLILLAGWLADFETPLSPALAAVLFGSCSVLLPAGLRTGSQNSLSLLMIAGMGISIGFPIVAVKETLTLPPAALAAGLALAVIGWGWTYFEIRWGRNTFLPMPNALATWRGVGRG